MIEVKSIAIQEVVNISETVSVAVPAAFDVGDSADVTITGTLTNTGKGFALKGSGFCTLNAICGSCLSPVRLSLEFPIVENFTQEPKQEDDITFQGDTIDLLPAAEKNLFLNIPMAARCSKDCAGLCQSCGCDLNIRVCGCAVNIDV